MSHKPFETELIADPAEAVARATTIYETNTSALRDAFARYRRGELPDSHVHAYYPFVRVRTDVNANIDSRHSYGFVSGPGIFETTLENEFTLAQSAFAVTGAELKAIQANANRYRFK